MKLYGYFRSSASYRVRIALNLKGLDAEHLFIHIRNGDQDAPGYRSINPLGLIPTLEHEGQLLSQSLAIIEYLEEIQPSPRLLPELASDRAYVRSIALSIACDIHPLNNLRVLNYLSQQLAISKERKDSWYAHWVDIGLGALESVLSRDPRVGAYCFGDSPSLADICLVPQIFNAERMNCDMTKFPTISRIVATARNHPAFAAAAPERQGDASG